MSSWCAHHSECVERVLVHDRDVLKKLKSWDGFHDSFHRMAEVHVHHRFAAIVFASNEELAVTSCGA
jgi:hypothetical protein